MTPCPYDAWALGRAVCGYQANGELAAVVDDTLKAMAAHLFALPKKVRGCAWDAMRSARADCNDLIMAMANVDPKGPAPPIDPLDILTAAHLRSIMSNTRWLWPGWIPAATIIGMAAEQGTGKTRFALDLCSRAWNTREWPDGQPMTLPPQSRTLWLCSDGQESEILDELPNFGIPDEALIFTGRGQEPAAYQSLDDLGTYQRIDELVAACRPVILFIDSLSYATTLNLCEMQTIARLKTPLGGIVQRHQIVVALLLHTAKEGNVFGRHVKGITRSLLQIECPDPTRRERLRLWVERPCGKRPPALGVTMHDAGNEYDFDPPTRLDLNKGGRPPQKRDKGIEFLTRKLTQADCRAIDLVSEWTAIPEAKGTLFNARDAMVADGRLVVDDSRKPQVWHLVNKA
jgi:hypothetical protein